MIALIDYGMGNLHSVTKALEHVGGEVKRVRAAADLAGCDRVVFPGVGAFRDCMETLRARQLDMALLQAVDNGVPLLGICLGMQALMERSHERGLWQGLGLMAGEVVPFDDGLPQRGNKIPHMGWNSLETHSNHPVLAAVGDRQLYFVHSYIVVPEHAQHVLATTNHGGTAFASAVGRDNLIGVQFHPEKSQQAGLDLLAAFLAWQP